MQQASIYRVPSDSDSSIEYEVTFLDDGSARCGCQAYKYSGRNSCKHIERLKANGQSFVDNRIAVWRVASRTRSDVYTEVHEILAAVDHVVDTLSVGESVVVERLA